MNNEEFIKIIKKYGEIKSVQEAFEKYPVEEEEHKGRLESYLGVSEDVGRYNYKYKIGDIVYVKNFKYENGKYGKNHLFVIIGEENLAVSMEYFGMLISSKVHKIKYKQNKFLLKDSKNHLNVNSIIKTDVIYKIEKAEIVLKIGEVDNINIEEYKQSYLEVLKNKKKISKEDIEYLNEHEELQSLAELREIWELDERSALRHAKEEGIKEGKLAIAKKLKEMNINVKDIQEATELYIDEIEKL